MKDEAADKLRGMLARMGMEGEVVANEDEERVTLEVRGVEAGLTTQIPERREAPDRALAEQVPARPPDLRTPDHNP